MLRDFSISLVRTLRDRGHQAYLVGGCVRDILLGREPEDYDVATSATPDEVMRIFPRAYGVGVQFGVVLVPVPPEQRIARFVRDDKGLGDEATTVEVATFRSDIGSSDGRHPP